MRSPAWLVWCLAALIAGQACASEPGGQPEAASRGQTRPSAPKDLTVAVQAEPTTFSELGVAITSAGSDRYIAHLAHDYLTVETERKVRIPQLAAEALSAERGTWRVNADGTMDTVWKIRPDAKWHDGTLLSSGDLLFAFGVYKDPQVPNRAGQGVELMRSSQAPDPYTLAVRWSTPYFAADQAPGLFPMPRHLLEELYLRDKEAFVSSPRFTTEFVGLGPYRLVRWEPGSHMEFTRFGDYYRGRPPLDTIVVRWYADPNALVANILAEAVDAVLPVGVRLEDALELKQRWTGTGHQVVADLSGRLRYLEIQHRVEFARPINGLTNRGVRQAMYHATDRHTLVDATTYLVPRVLSGNPELSASFPGGLTSNRPITADNFSWTTAQIPTAQTRWLGQNRGSFSDPEVDRFNEAALTATSPRPWLEANIGLHRRMSEMLGTLPLFYPADVIVARHPIEGPAGHFSYPCYSWNIWEWGFAS